MSGSGRETLPYVGDALSDVQEWSGDPTGYPGVVGRTLLDVREWLGGPPGCPGLVGRPSRMFRSGREALADVWA